jgi:hypothetical protein
VLLLAVLAFVGFIVYDHGRQLVETVGPFYALLVVIGVVVVFRIADFVVPRRDGESWFWSVIRSGAE